MVLKKKAAKVLTTKINPGQIIKVLNLGEALTLTWDD